MHTIPFHEFDGYRHADTRIVTLDWGIEHEVSTWFNAATHFISMIGLAGFSSL